MTKYPLKIMRPNNDSRPHAWIEYGKHLSRQDKHAEATAALQEATTRFPGNGLIHAHLGMAFLRAGEREAGLLAFLRAVELSPSPPEWFLRGVSALEHETVELHRVTLNVPPDVISPEVMRYLIEGSYEGKELAVLQQCLQKNERILELGAGLGFLACYVGHALPDTPYVAVEANPSLIQVILDNFRKNGCRAELIHGAAALRSGSTSFNVARDFWASTVCKVSQDHLSIEVPSINTNAVISAFSPTMMIVDIEGGELELLPNLDLSGVRKLIVELHPDSYGHRGSTEVIRNLLNAGFDVDARLSGSQVFMFTRE